MKRTPARIFMSLLVLGLAFTHLSCSSNLSELTGSVSLEIPQSIVSRASLEGENEGNSELYVVAMVKGDDYAAAQYKTIREGSLSSDDRFMKLLDIPTEKNIRIDMTIIDSQGVRKYYGSTGTFYVQHGINVQNIRLTRITEAAGTVSDAEVETGYADYNGCNIGDGINLSNGSIYLYPDGWYKIISEGQPLSEGIWEGSISEIVHLTEYIYREINPIPAGLNINNNEPYYNTYPNNIIAENPMEYDIRVNYSSDAPDEISFQFTLRNGVRIYFNLF